MRHQNLLDSSGALLLVVDVQDAFLKAIHEPERVVANTVKLVEAAKVFSLPIIVTVQNEARMGGTTQAVMDVLPNDVKAINKMAFSCMGAEYFPEQLNKADRRQVLICGVETHICVSQTAHDLLAQGYRVHVAKDAVSSRTLDNWDIGIEKMRSSGCVITSTEAAIFEITKDASGPEFKRILPIIK